MVTVCTRAAQHSQFAIRGRRAFACRLTLGMLAADAPLAAVATFARQHKFCATPPPSPLLLLPLTAAAAARALVERALRERPAYPRLRPLLVFALRSARPPSAIAARRIAVVSLIVGAA